CVDLDCAGHGAREPCAAVPADWIHATRPHTIWALTTWLLFLLFGSTLLGIATAHRHALWFATAGLCCVLVVRLRAGCDLAAHFGHEWPGLVTLGGLLLGFAVLADHFAISGLPHRLTAILPDGRLGAFLLLALVCLLSSVLDNIAAALIGG